MPVIAAAVGTIIPKRDGIHDLRMRLLGKKSALHRGVGNFVIIDHGSGWWTQCTHMRKGSIAVKPVMRITSDKQLGLVGQSGLTEFRHLQFEINHSSQTVNPFVSKGNGKGCKDAKNTLQTGAALPVLKFQKYF